MRRYFQKLIHFIQIHREKLIPLLIAAIALFAYGLLSPWLGFYWDDWPKALFAETIGPQAFSDFAAHRPLNGKWYVLFTSLLDARPLAWQWLALLFRTTSAIAFWAVLKQIWPKSRDFAAWAAILFLIYPGFTQQNIALSYYIHFLAQTLLFLSFYFSAKALRSPTKALLFHSIALILSLVTMLTTDYFYGLELLRVFIFGIILWKSGKNLLDNLMSALKPWSPYLLLVIALFGWRSSLDARESYEIAIFDDLLNSSISPALLRINDMLNDLWEASVLAWLKLSQIFQDFEPQSKISWITLAMMFLVWLILWAFFSSPYSDEKRDTKISSHVSKLLLGFSALFLANIPVWTSGLEPSLKFPANRLNLPASAGAALLLASMLVIVVRARKSQILVVATIIALSSAFHFQVSNSYREDYEKLASFQQQLTWRAPSLTANTAFITQEMPFAYMSDDFLTGALNLIYPSDDPAAHLNIALFYLDLRLGTKLPTLESDQPIYWDYRLIDFSGNTSQSLVIYYAPPACLRILDAVYDRSFPLLPQPLRDALSLSNTSSIDAAGGIEANLSPQLFPVQDENSWCHYFQRADLARQKGDWQEIAQLGNAAFALDNSPNHASERIPFIEAYARIGNWDRSIELSRESIQINKFMEVMLCETWQRIDLAASDSPEKNAAFIELSGFLSCNSNQ